MNSTIQCLSATYPFTSYFLGEWDLGSEVGVLLIYWVVGRWEFQEVNQHVQSIGDEGQPGECVCRASQGVVEGGLYVSLASHVQSELSYHPTIWSFDLSGTFEYWFRKEGTGLTMHSKKTFGEIEKYRWICSPIFRHGPT